MTFGRLHITVFLALAVAAWAVVLFIQGTPISSDHITPFGTVVGIMVGLGLLFEHILWRQRWLHGWFVKRPDLRGTWGGEIESTWVNPDTKKTVPVTPCFVGVEQTLSRLKLHVMSCESESWLLAEKIIPSNSGDGFQIVGVYTNKPRIDLRGSKSVMHLGALVLDTHGPSSHPEELTGEYWTDRKSSGRIKVQRKCKHVFTQFEKAEEAFKK